MVDLNNSKVDGSAALSGTAVLDAGCMAELRALDPDGTAHLVQRVLTTYLASLDKLGAQMREASAGAAWDQVSRVAHTLKSSSASIGALALSASCAEIERLLRAGDEAAAAALVADFHAQAQRVAAAVAVTLKQSDPAAS